mmetsp:Transcript_440/g.1509  ORF Transcript_440/g.1509 Transcript_440/m.1509 type:complete len:105 (+) Transcript_440:1697-2011(+)
MRRTASTARRAISRIPARTSTGAYQKAVADQSTQSREDFACCGFPLARGGAVSSGHDGFHVYRWAHISGVEYRLRVYIACRVHILKGRRGGQLKGSPSALSCEN